MGIIGRDSFEYSEYLIIHVIYFFTFFFRSKKKILFVARLVNLLNIIIEEIFFGIILYQKRDLSIFVKFNRSFSPFPGREAIESLLSVYRLVLL